MEQYELETESGLKLSRQGAQSVMEGVEAIVEQNISMVDRGGYMIASTDEAGIGSLHEEAGRAIEEHLTELYMGEEHAAATSRPGLSLPVSYGKGIVGVIGTTGLYNEVVGYRQVIEKVAKVLIRKNTEQDERRIGQRILNRFLENWVIGGGLIQPKILKERGFALDIDIAMPRCVMVASAGELEKYASAAARQKLLEQMEQESTSLTGRGGPVLKSDGRQVILVKKCSDYQMEQLVGRIRAAVLKKFNIRMVVGINGRAKSTRVTYG